MYARLYFPDNWVATSNPYNLLEIMDKLLTGTTDVAELEQYGVVAANSKIDASVKACTWVKHMDINAYTRIYKSQIEGTAYPKFIEVRQSSRNLYLTAYRKWHDVTVSERVWLNSTSDAHNQRLLYRTSDDKPLTWHISMSNNHVMTAHDGYGRCFYSEYIPRSPWDKPDGGFVPVVVGCHGSSYYPFSQMYRTSGNYPEFYCNPIPKANDNGNFTTESVSTLWVQTPTATRYPGTADIDDFFGATSRESRALDENKHPTYQMQPMFCHNPSIKHMGGDLTSLNDIWLTVPKEGGFGDTIEDGAKVYEIWPMAVGDVSAGAVRLAVRIG